MKTVNLLPAWYQRQQRRRRNLRRHIAVMLALGAAMVGARFLAGHQVATLKHQRDGLETTVKQIPDPEAQLRHEQTDLKRLQDLQLARRELGNTVPMSAVVQQLQNDMTPGMALSNVLIEVQRQAVKGSGMVGDTRNPPRYHDVAHLTVTGYAPYDSYVARLIDSVSKNPLFSEVTLDFTRTGLLHNYPVRKFEIQLEMDLEPLTAQAVDTSSAAGSLAGADASDSAQSGGPAHGD